MGMGIFVPMGTIELTRGNTRTPGVGTGSCEVWVRVVEKIPGGYPCNTLLTSDYVSTLVSMFPCLPDTSNLS
jgi:hypothetical protein